MIFLTLALSIDGDITAFLDHLAWARFTFFHLALKLRQLIAMDKARGYRTPITWSMVIDLKRQNYQRKKQLEQERKVLEEVKAKYGCIPDWLKCHVPLFEEEYEALADIGENLNEIKNELREVRYGIEMR